MTNLEHLIENTLYSMKKYSSMPYKEILHDIRNDINYEEAGITAEQCFEICQYIYYTYTDNITNKNNSIVDDRIKYCVYSEEKELFNSDPFSNNNYVSVCKLTHALCNKETCKSYRNR